MRHGKKFNHLKRKVGHRRALLKNMSGSLIEHKRIFTTLAKAKALRLYLEPLVTKSKTNTTHSRRVVYSYLNNKDVVKELFEIISPKIATRPGGYLRIIKMGFRQSDSAEMAMIEFVDFNDVLPKTGSGSADGKKRRSRRGGKKKAASTVVAAATATKVTASNKDEEE